MDAAYINYRDPIAEDELLLNNFLDSLNISWFSSHMQRLELFLHNFSIDSLQAAGLVFSTSTDPVNRISPAALTQAVLSLTLEEFCQWWDGVGCMLSVTAARLLRLPVSLDGYGR